MTSTSEPLALGVDIGGSKIAAGVVAADGTIVDEIRRPTPGADVTQTADAIIGVARDLMSRHSVGVVGIGAAGWINSDRSTVVFSPHLAWRGEPLRESLTTSLDVPVYVDNDANATAWAEYRFGAAQGSRVALCVTLGTGIGGGIIADGQIFRGAFGLAGEWGHMRVVPGGRRCACGNRGCWEQYASGRALARDARDVAETSPVTAQGLLAVVDGVPSALTGPLVTQAAAANDPTAMEIVNDAGHWLGQGIADICAILDPDIVVVGGGVAEVGSLILDPARAAFGHALTGRGFRPEPPIVGARLGSAAGLVGAADLARSSL
ncbi:glucokinase [Antricoccus suffuscus]|uniref:Glucokinase n=1 Tax=Antricoccus suffuscus TaxID=1629062 RepID=A0A2T0ZYD7_9ACTN|nr:ROK family glucokinase [Antricoccus suffuscus]PRZ41372.1 glucokinase [Antricoccus suffuscus]